MADNQKIVKDIEIALKNNGVDTTAKNFGYLNKYIGQLYGVYNGPQNLDH